MQKDFDEIHNPNIPRDRPLPKKKEREGDSISELERDKKREKPQGKIVQAREPLSHWSTTLEPLEPPEPPDEMEPQ